MESKKLRLIVVRHGNTFAKGDTLLRVGSRTDLDLVESEKGTKAGNYIAAHNYSVDRVYSGPLKRQMQTTDLICDVIGFDKGSKLIDERFNEVDYGRFDGMPEEDVVAELGKDALKAWDADCIVPAEWTVDVEGIKEGWSTLLAEVEKDAVNSLIVSSNGLIRFLPYVLECDTSELTLKVSTGGVVVLEKDSADADWQVVVWGAKPE